MNIGLVQLDGKLPNIALMQLAAYHKDCGNSVEWWTGPLFPYDKVYASKIFGFTEDDLPDYVIKGGTGYDWHNQLPDEVKASSFSGGWFLYPNYYNHIGFSERGCRLNCSFCVVPQKEGKPRKVADVSELLTNPKGENVKRIIIDRDINGAKNILKIAKSWLKNKTRPFVFCRNNKS